MRSPKSTFAEPLAIGRPSIGVVIPAFNAADFLSNALDSVLEQTCPVDDIVVVDDGSTDQTEDIVRCYANDGVRYIKQINQGSASARNTGIRSLSTDYVCFLDADDAWLPDKTAAQAEILQRYPEVGLVSGDQIYCDPDRSFRKIRKFSNQSSTRLLARRLAFSNIVGNPSMVMIRQSIFDTIGLFDVSLRFGDDWDMWLRIANESTIAFAKQPVAIYHWHSQNQSQLNQTACLRTYRQISRNAINRSIAFPGRPFAYSFLLRHTVLYIWYRSFRSFLGAHLRQIQSALSSRSA